MRARLQQSLPSRLMLWSRETGVVLLVLVLIVWLGHYYNLWHFGLYEDDYTYISKPLGWNRSDLLSHLLHVWSGWPQGRPMGYTLPQTVAFFGGKLDGLAAIFVAGSVVHVTNAFLFYLLLRKLSSQGVALMGSLALILFPADTTHIFLMHSLGLHTALTFLLLAGLLYFSRYRMASYLPAMASLLTYESCYMVFLALPLLRQPRDKGGGRQMLRHAVLWLGVLAAVVAVRAVRGEDRLAAIGSSPTQLPVILIHVVAALAMGPAVALASFGFGPAWTLLNWRWELTLVFVVGVAVFGWILSRGRVLATEDLAGERPIRNSGLTAGAPLRRSLTQDPRIGRLLLASLAMLSLAYGLSFSHFPPTALYGRMTSVHLAATLGGSLFFACLCSMLLAWARSKPAGFLAIGVLALYLSLLLSYRFAIQLDFRNAWSNQKAFWSNALALIPDVSDGTMIFVPNHDLPTTRFILSNSWADPIMLEQIYDFPSDWERAPRLFVVPSDWTSSIRAEGGQLKWQVPAATWKPHREVLPDGNVIMLEMQNGGLVRRTGTISVAEVKLNLKPLPSGTPGRFREGPLYRYLIRDGE